MILVAFSNQTHYIHATNGFPSNVRTYIDVETTSTSHLMCSAAQGNILVYRCISGNDEVMICYVWFHCCFKVKIRKRAQMRLSWWWWWLGLVVVVVMRTRKSVCSSLGLLAMREKALETTFSVDKCKLSSFSKAKNYTRTPTHPHLSHICCNSGIKVKTSLEIVCINIKTCNLLVENVLCQNALSTQRSSAY